MNSDVAGPDADLLIARAMQLWLGITGALVGIFVVVVLANGLDVITTRLILEPYKERFIIYGSLVLIWLTLGAGIHLLGYRQLRARHGLLILCSMMLVILYANVFRERMIYGDAEVYLDAARRLLAGELLPEGYVYPPFVATLLGYLLPHGLMSARLILWLANILSVGLLLVLLSRLLEEYAFPRRSAVLVSTLFLVLNVPVLRTLAYMQVNLHVMNLIVLSLLAYPRSRMLSAGALAVAIHVKASPVVLLLPFIMVRDWRWQIRLAAALIILAVPTLAIHGFDPFRHFISGIPTMHEIGGPLYRNTSLDSFLMKTGVFLQISASISQHVANGLKLLLLGIVLLVMRRNILHSTFVRRDDASGTVLNAAPSLLVFMLLASPLLWEHHHVFVMLPMLLLLMRSMTQGELLLYLSAYVAMYLLPTFDMYPLSYLRLLGPLVLLYLLHRVSGRDDECGLIGSLEGATNGLWVRK